MISVTETRFIELYKDLNGCTEAEARSVYIHMVLYDDRRAGNGGSGSPGHQNGWGDEEPASTLHSEFRK